MSVLGFLLNKPVVEMTPEQKISQMQINEMKRLRRRESTDRLRTQLGFVFKHITPKGVKDPNKMVRNIHLYAPPRDGKKHVTRLY